jgi:ribosomal protein S9
LTEAEKVDVNDEENVDVEDTENVDVDVEKDVKVDDTESEVDVDVKASMPGESEDVEEVQALLMKAQQAAKTDLGDEKLTDQIGNTITYFTRSHVSRVAEVDVDADGDRSKLQTSMMLLLLKSV